MMNLPEEYLYFMKTKFDMKNNTLTPFAKIDTQGNKMQREKYEAVSKGVKVYHSEIRRCVGVSNNHYKIQRNL